MNFFTVNIVQTGEELCVAARTSDHAAEVFLTFWCARTGQAPGEFHVRTEPAKAYENNPVVENIAAGEMAGVLVHQSDGSMLFEPAIG